MAAPPFFYYNPEQNADPRQQGLFTPHPSTILSAHQMQRFQQPMYVQDLVGHHESHMIERPASSQLYMQAQFPSPAVSVPGHGHLISPRPLCHKPAAIFTERSLSLDTDCSEGDGHMYPATPPLSISGSTISSPPMSSGILPTPTGPVFFSENIEGVKQGCEVEVKSEILAGGDWARCGSPLLAPGESSKHTLQILEHYQYYLRCCDSITINQEV